MKVGNYVMGKEKIKVKNDLRIESVLSNFLLTNALPEDEYWNLYRVNLCMVAFL